MKRYTCVIIDDEQFAIDWLTGYVNATPNLILIKTYCNAIDALTELSGQDMVDLILLDIEMPVISGLDLSLKIRHLTRKLVFITAYRHYAYEAFEAAADGYLLKPFTLSRFASTVTKLFMVPQPAAGKPADEEFFFVKNKMEDAKLVSIRYQDIVAIESKRNDILIHTLSTGILTHMTLSDISTSLRQRSGFAQFQRSFIINTKHIDHIYGNTIRMVTGLNISVGDYYRKDFSSFLTEKILKGRG